MKSRFEDHDDTTKYINTGLFYTLRSRFFKNINIKLMSSTKTEIRMQRNKEKNISEMLRSAMAVRKR